MENSVSKANEKAQQFSATTKKRYSDTTIQRYRNRNLEPEPGIVHNLCKLEHFAPQEIYMIIIYRGGGAASYPGAMCCSMACVAFAWINLIDFVVRRLAESVSISGADCDFWSGLNKLDF